VTDQPSFGRAGLIAPDGETKGYEGAGIFEAVMGIKDGFAAEDGFAVGANGLVVGLSGLGAITDPFQAVFAAGVGWLIEHLDVLREPLDWLAGDPKEIEGHAATWRNIQGRVYEATDYFVSEVKSATTYWTSEAASAYRARAGRHAEEVQSLGEIADLMAKATAVAGALVGAVRNTVRDLIAEVVGAAISKALQAVAVVTIPKVVAEVGLLVAECSAKITALLNRLLKAVGRIAGEINRAKPILEWLNDSLKTASHNVTISDAYRLEAVGGLNRSDGLLSSYRSAFGTISQGHRAVHGSTVELAEESLGSAMNTNLVQNGGALPEQISEGAQARPPIQLPL
jgi:hypothetical protein